MPAALALLGIQFLLFCLNLLILVVALRIHLPTISPYSSMAHRLDPVVSLLKDELCSHPTSHLKGAKNPQVGPSVVLLRVP